MPDPDESERSGGFVPSKFAAAKRVVGDTGDTATSNDVAKGGHDTEYAQGAKYGEYETDEAFRAIQAWLGRCDFGVKVARIERIEEVVRKLLVGD